MTKLEGLGRELALEKARIKAAVGTVPPPGSLTSDLHGIPFVAGDKVYDTVTGAEGEVLGAGVRNVETGE